MAQLVIKAHEMRGGEVIEILEMLGGKNTSNLNGRGFGYPVGYSIEQGEITTCCYSLGNKPYKVFTLEEFEEKYPYRVGDEVLVTYFEDVWKIIEILWSENLGVIHYGISNGKSKELVRVEELKPYKEEKTFPPYMVCDIRETETKEEDKNMGEVSDGYHTFNELYEYRLLYNAGMFNEFAKQGLYNVHKSKLHSDGSIPFNNPNWFIVQAELPTGQISNHYEMKDWDLFEVPIKERANTYDGHTSKDVAERMKKFLTPCPQYPKTYNECCDILGITPQEIYFDTHYTNVDELFETLYKLYICRNAYWKIANDWIPDEGNSKNIVYCITVSDDGEEVIRYNFQRGFFILMFPTEEMRDTFYENFKDLIEGCKEFL